MSVVDERFRCMGCDARIRLEGDADGLEAAAARARGALEEVERTLSRFDPDSELSRLNRDPRPVVAASPLLGRFVAAAAWAAQASEGLVDATLADALAELMGDPGRRATLGAAAAERARRYTVEAMAAGMMDVFAQVQLRRS